MADIAPNISYSEASGHVVYDLPMFENLPKTYWLGGYMFDRKSELHITLLAARERAAGLALTEEKLLDAVAKAAAKHELSFTGLQLPLYLCEKDNAQSRSIAVRANLKGIDELFAALQEIAGVTVFAPFPHVTLFTYGDPQGVAITDPNNIAERCSILDAPDIFDLL